ncbi:MAG: RNA polymerase sporulation sigma factor SigG [Clostridia bacterium]|nr:RNA polymerase sporulation sigma factor SigG [Clostridia bacterium]MBQ3849829.1 RNA polymerase sporulation sigma factor SigG [Clostridia bacterium]MBR3459698.1 RNA polymerase sporulation sigma factor SigG [Clostridia bacterium]MBR5718699.1 RNA polymerase sporulation sigma factor SigG [Clostridia bacterium]
MASGKVEICGINTGKLPRMDSKRSEELLSRISCGDNTAREEFIEGNLRLVLSVIQRFSGRGEPPDDLFQIGCIGLIKAIDNFDTSHGVRFSTYAVPMIIGEVRRYLRDNSSMRVSRSIRDTAYHALRERASLEYELGREPTIAEIAKALNVPEEDVVFALDAIADPVSLNEPIFRDDGDAVFIVDQVKDEKASEENWLNSVALRSGMDHLPERERRIIELRFFLGRTQTEVASEIGISQAQVSRLEKHALGQMRKFV